MKTLAGFAAACAMAAAQYFSPVPHRPMPAPNATGNGVIEGTVVNKITREPMKKVIVTLMGKISLTAVTDASGHFAFKDLAAGQYTLEARPVADGGPRQNPSRSVDLAADEHISDISVAVTPPSSISGRVVDEDRVPVQNCRVTAIASFEQNGRRTTVQIAQGQSDASGKYQLDRIAPGKYYMMALCQIQLPLPHPLMDRNSPDIPMQRYPLLLYPGSTTMENAQRITVRPGVNASGIDFQMTLARSVTINGRLHGVMPEGLHGDVKITLRASGEMNSIQPEEGAHVDPQSGTFHISSVLPGSYDLTATSSGAYAQASLNIGATAPDPIDLTLSPLPAISGSVRVDGDAKVSLTNRDIYLNPLDNQILQGPTNGQIKEDGTFTIAGVPPGRWSLMMDFGGYIKSMQLNDQDVSPEAFELPSGTPIDTVRIVVGNDWAQMDGNVSPATQGAQIFGFVWREDSEASGQMFDRQFSVNPSGQFRAANLAPGKYRACAFENPVGMAMLRQNMELREKMRSRCEAVELEEGGHATVQLTAIGREDFDKLLAESEDQ